MFFATKLSLSVKQNSIQVNFHSFVERECENFQNCLSSNLSKSNFIPLPCWWKDDALHRVFAFYAGWRPWAAQAKGSINCACYIPTLHSALWDKGVEVMSSVLHNDLSYIVVVSVLA